MKSISSVLIPAFLLVATGTFTACNTDSAGVKSSYHSQWTTVGANTGKATDAAKDALQDLKLQKIEAKSTEVDGIATGYTADNKKITVDVRKVTDTTSEVSVNVGTVGDPELGKQIIAGIRKHLG
jgi:pyridoxal/pyridoxine/pyridoxamine kinase